MDVERLVGVRGILRGRSSFVTTRRSYWSLSGLPGISLSSIGLYLEAHEEESSSGQRTIR